MVKNNRIPPYLVSPLFPAVQRVTHPPYPPADAVGHLVALERHVVVPAVAPHVPGPELLPVPCPRSAVLFVYRPCH